MPKLSVMLGRKTIQVCEIDKPTIRVGRDPDADIAIENLSVSRNHAELRREGETWLIEDLGSANGTFLNGECVDGPQAVAEGDEIGLGKFSLIFGKHVGAVDTPSPRVTAPAADGTTRLKSHEIEELLEDSTQQRGAHLAWQSGGEEGVLDLADRPAALIGTDELCDLRVPDGPKHHLLVIWDAQGCEVRNLHRWSVMKVSGQVTNRARLADEDVIEMGGLTLTFRDDFR